MWNNIYLEIVLFPNLFSFFRKFINSSTHTEAFPVIWWFVKCNIHIILKTITVSVIAHQWCRDIYWYIRCIYHCTCICRCVRHILFYFYFLSNTCDGFIFFPCFSSSFCAFFTLLNLLRTDGTTGPNS